MVDNFVQAVGDAGAFAALCVLFTDVIEGAE